VTATFQARRCFLRPGVVVSIFLWLHAAYGNAAPAAGLFDAGVKAYRASDYAQAAETFRSCVAEQPASGALQNLGNAEWQQRRVGNAILAWEQAVWLNPFDRNARNNLHFAREMAQLEAPELNWCELVSTWLPANWWAWATAITLWTTAGLMTIPTILRRRKSSWQQAIAALTLGILLLTTPAHIGAATRARIGFILQKNVPLRLTPTAEAEVIVRLAPGEPVRKLRSRGNYVFVRTNHSAGWVEKSEFGLIAGN
jgi:tetratricopeptide (TPR) repeat protein